MNSWNRAVFAVLASALAAASPATPPARADATPLTSEQRRDVIDGLVGLLDEIYVIPGTADAMIARLRSDLDGGRFESETDPSAFAATLTGILQEMSGDKHLRVSHGGAGDGAAGPPRVVRRAPGGGAMPGGLEAVEPFPRAEMLAGNVGVVEVRLFPPREMAEERAVRAMEAVAGADALLFDLRGCMGGSPDMIHLIISYLYGPQPMHLLTYYHAREAPDSAYTLAEVPGRRMPDVPVYVVTSGFTASGGEEFAYDLKHHGRATVVGELTAGGGHGGGVHPVAAGFQAFIPDFRPVHPVTGGGWEGAGVEPDLEAPADGALDVAHREALREIVRRHPQRADALAGDLSRLDAEIERSSQPVDAAALREYAGVYEIRTIRVQDDGLTLQRTGGPELLLVPAGEPDAFALRLMPSARIRFVRDAAGAVTELHVRNMQGEWEVSRRSAGPGAP